MNRTALCGVLMGALVSATCTGWGVSASDESTTVELQLPDEASRTKIITVKAGDKLQELLKRCLPAQPAVDDDPWLVYRGPGTSHYYLIFSPTDAKGSVSDPLYAVIKYPRREDEDGTFLMPAWLRGRNFGRFRTIKVAADANTTRTAPAAIGMTPDEVMKVFEPAKDLAPEKDVIVFDAGPGAKYRLIFTESAQGLTLSKLNYEAEGKDPHGLLGQ